MKFREKAAAFMNGRYGPDQLFTALTWLCMLLITVNIFVRSPVLWILEAAVLIFSMYRCFSRNYTKRREENAKYITLIGKIKSFFSLRKRMFAERKTHAYRKCPSCKKILRLPKKKGSHTVCCPCCKTDFSCKI